MAPSKPTHDTRPPAARPQSGTKPEDGETSATGDTAANDLEPEPGELPAGLTEEQRELEKKRRTQDLQRAGTGEMAGPIHGMTRPVENSATSIPPSKPDPVTKARDDTPRDRKVRALKLVYYDDIRRRTGDVFMIRKPYDSGKKDKDGKPIMTDEFSPRSMEDVDASTPERTTTGKEDLRRQHDETLSGRTPTGDKRVIE